jgi:hypothetical protein
MVSHKRCYSSLHEGDRLVPLEDFGSNKTQPDSKATVCKVCTNLANKNRRADVSKNAKLKQNSKRYYKTHKEAYDARAKARHSTLVGYITKMVAQARCRARDRGYEFTITTDDVAIPEICPVLGIPLVFGQGEEFKMNCPSIDRIDSNKGYTKDNIVIVSWRANMLKCNATVEELRKLYEFYSMLEETKMSDTTNTQDQTQQPERRVFYIDVGDTPVDENVLKEIVDKIQDGQQLLNG